MEKDAELRTQYFDSRNLFLVPLTLPGIELMEEIKLSYPSHYYNLKICPKYRDRLFPHYPRRLLLKLQWHLILVKVISVDMVFIQDLRFLTKNFQQCTLKALKPDLGGLQHPLNM